MELLNGGTDGLRITSITSQPRATVAATLLQTFASADNGTTRRLIRVKLMAAATLATGNDFPLTDWGFTETEPLLVAPGERIYMGQAVTLAAGIVHDARGGAY